MSFVLATLNVSSRSLKWQFQSNLAATKVHYTSHIHHYSCHVATPCMLEGKERRNQIVERRKQVPQLASTLILHNPAWLYIFIKSEVCFHTDLIRKSTKCICLKAKTASVYMTRTLKQETKTKNRTFGSMNTVYVISTLERKKQMQVRPRRPF